MTGKLVAEPCAILKFRMADAKQSVLDKAESLARRVLERLGAKVDDKLASGGQHTLSAHVIGDLTSRIEQMIDSSLREDASGTRRLAPNRFKVLFTYEETSVLSQQYIEAVGKELTESVFEFINNRRYATAGPVEVLTGRDLFAKATVIKIDFDSDGSHGAASKSDAAPRAEQTKVISLTSGEQHIYRVELRPEGAPAYIGRAAGSAVRIDDPSISRLQCSLSLRSDGRVLIGDLGSANGTCVNEDLLGREDARALKPGDIIRVGDVELTVSEIT